MAISLEDIKKLSPKYKAIIICLVYIVLGYFYYFYFLQANLEKRGELQVKLQEMEKQISEKERLAAELGRYIKEVGALKEAFKVALTKLPVRKEIPELLRSVAYSGNSAGITFILFEPQATVKKLIGAGKEEGQKQPEQKTSEQKPPEQKNPEQKPPEQRPGDAKSKPEKPSEEGDYYEEIPVKVTVTGSYNKTAAFFEKVARLPRIINVEEVAIGNAKPQGKELFLNTSCIIKTYMFVQKMGEKDKKIDEKKP
jgi:type IV pilus assembly protein PilO